MNEEENRPLGARLFDAIDSGLEKAGDFIVDAAEDKPGIADDIVRGGIQGLSFIGNLPVIKQIGQAEEAIVGGVRNLAERQDFIDPRFFTYGTRIGIGIAADKGIGKVIKAGNKVRKIAKAQRMADKISALPKYNNPIHKSMVMKYIEDPNFEQLDLFNLDPTPNPRLPDELQDAFRAATADVGARGGKVLPGYMAAVGDSLIFDYKQFRKSIDGVKGADGRKFLELFQTPMSKLYIGKTTGDAKVFDVARKQYMAKMRAAYDPVMDAMGMNLDKPFNFQLHHIAALKTVMGIYDGVGYDSPLHRAITDRFLEKLKGIGNQSDNLLGVMGKTTDKDTTHQIAHLFLKNRTGKKGAGEAFFTDDVLTQMRASDKIRFQKVDDLSQIVMESEMIALQAQEVLDTLYAQGKAIPPNRLLSILDKLDDQGYLKSTKIDKQYQVKRLPKLIEDIVELDDAFSLIPQKTLIKAIGEQNNQLKILKILAKYAKDGQTPPANVINKVLKQKDLFLTSEEQVLQVLENWALTVRKKQATFKRNATRRNQELYRQDPDVYFPGKQ